MDGWADALQMGSPTLVSQLMSLNRKAPGQYLDYITRMTKEQRHDPVDFSF